MYTGAGEGELTLGDRLSLIHLFIHSFADS